MLADDRFDTEAAYETYLASNPDPVSFLENELLFSEDRFTFYSEDYTELANISAGIFKSNGLQFGLGLIGDSDDVFGFVEYVVKNSDASSKEIQRGDVFIGVNGTQLNRNNYIELLFGDNDTYTLNMAVIANNTISPSDKEVTLTKEENLLEDPILVTNVISSGDRTIGYLMYNQFVSGSEDELNTIFTDFASQGITDLVLDLRYNGGGRGDTAMVLGSLIYGTNTNDLFYRDRYNAKLQAIFDGDTDNFFKNTTGTANGNSDTALNSLNLSQVYIIATGASASASELLMVGLEPYLDVVHVGTTTVGKNEGSLLFVDDPEGGNVYDPERVDQINPNVQWGLQPIIVRAENSVGFSDYSNGLIPDIELGEDAGNLGVLGNADEPLLARAIQEINGLSAKRNFEVKMPINLISSSKLYDQRNTTLLLNQSKPNSNNPLIKQKSNSK